MIRHLTWRGLQVLMKKHPLPKQDHHIYAACTPTLDLAPLIGCHLHVSVIHIEHVLKNHDFITTGFQISCLPCRNLYREALYEFHGVYV